MRYRQPITAMLGMGGVGLCFLLPALHGAGLHGVEMLIAHVGAAALVVAALVLNITGKSELPRKS